MRRTRKGAVAPLCAVLACLAGVPTAHAAFDDPLFLMVPEPPVAKVPGEMPARVPPISGELVDPCGVAVDETGRVYVSDYVDDAVDLFAPTLGPVYPYGYLSQIPAVDPLDGPCGVDVDATGNVYVNDYHRSVIKYVGATATTLAGYPLDSERPTGVAVDRELERVYVNERDHIEILDLFGNSEGEVGATTLDDGYGLAVSRYPATEGFLYVADAATDTVEVYDPETEPVAPVLELDGSETPLGHFVSLRDAALAVDGTTGELYVTDNLEPQTADHPEAVVYVFEADGTYEGRLKCSLVHGQPPGLAVDNSPTANQGRVYVTTGNTERSGVYAYPPHAATEDEMPLPPLSGTAFVPAAPAIPEAVALGATSPSVPAVVTEAVPAVAGHESTPAVVSRKSAAERRHKGKHRAKHPRDRNRHGSHPRSPRR